MSGPRPLHTSALAVAVLALALVLAPVAAVPVDQPPTERPGPDALPAPGDALPTTAGTAPVVAEGNTTGYLDLDTTIRTSRFGTATFDVGGAVAADSGRTRSIYRATRLRTAFTGTEGNLTAQRAVVTRSADRIDDDITALEQRAQVALNRYNSGAISARSYLRELAAIDAAADSLRGTLDLLSTYNSVADEPIPSARIAAQKARLLPLQGPVRDRALAAMRGDGPPVRIFIQTSDEGVVLATIDRRGFTQRYIREAHVPSARDPGGVDRFDLAEDRLEAASDRSRNSYPWTWENRISASIGSFQGQPFLYTAGVYSVRIGHPHGADRTYDLITFIDGSTEEVFREIQYKDLSEIPLTRAATNDSDGVSLSVDRTRSGGPMRVTATNASTGEPLAADVLVNGETVGRTGSEGRYWVIAPRPTANVTVVHEGAAVSVEIFSDGAPTG